MSAQPPPRPGPLDTQRCFRQLLRALAEPGVVTAPGPLDLVLVTLTDHEVLVAEPGDARWPAADVLVIRGGDSGGRLRAARRGTRLDPQDGATAVYEVAAVGEGPLALRLAGPGVPPEGRTVRVHGLGRDELAAIQDTRVDYPMGVDVLLLDRRGRCVGLPRSTAVETLGPLVPQEGS